MYQRSLSVNDTVRDIPPSEPGASMANSVWPHPSLKAAHSFAYPGSACTTRHTSQFPTQ